MPTNIPLTIALGILPPTVYISLIIFNQFSLSIKFAPNQQIKLITLCSTIVIEMHQMNSHILSWESHILVLYLLQS